MRRAGADALPDCELMELVLFAAIPLKDVKPLAKELVRVFGSFADAIAAPRERLEEMPREAAKRRCPACCANVAI